MDKSWLVVALGLSCTFEALADPSTGVEPMGAHEFQMETLGQYTNGSSADSEDVILPPNSDAPDAVVYGYLAYWSDDLTSVPWDKITHIALFNAESDSNGNLSDTSRWDLAADAVALAEPYGVKVHLCVTNFSGSSIGAFLDSPTAQTKFINQLRPFVEDSGVHGVNIDFENMASDRREEMVEFTKDLEEEFGEVVLATPAVDWGGDWDYSELSKHADLFIMGYGYYWTGSSYAGPTDLLYGGSPWGSKSLEWTVDDYLSAGADPSRVILGLPLYGNEWPVSSNTIPAPATGNGSAVTFAAAKSKVSQYGGTFEEVSRSSYYYTGSRQGWYNDQDSVIERIQFAIDEEIAGVGFWALHYDGGDQDLWDEIGEVTRFLDDEDTGTDTGDDQPVHEGYDVTAGPPILAHAGDTVVLQIGESSGPSGESLEYQWRQINGPDVELENPISESPSFVVESADNLSFEVRVGNGTDYSAPAVAWVVVLSDEEETGGCGCSQTGSSSGFWLSLLVLPWFLRRRGQENG